MRFRYLYLVALLLFGASIIVGCSDQRGYGDIPPSHNETILDWIVLHRAPLQYIQGYLDADNTRTGKNIHLTLRDIVIYLKDNPEQINSSILNVLSAIGDSSAQNSSLAPSIIEDD